LLEAISWSDLHSWQTAPLNANSSCIVTINGHTIFLFFPYRAVEVTSFSCPSQCDDYYFPNKLKDFKNADVLLLILFLFCWF